MQVRKHASGTNEDVQKTEKNDRWDEEKRATRDERDHLYESISRHLTCDLGVGLRSLG